MTSRQVLIFALTILTLASCRSGYKVEDGNVYYEYWHEGLGFEQGKRLVEGADAKSFESLSFDCDCSFEFGKDKNYLFIDGDPIRKIDPNTFTFIGNYIFRDKDSAYFFGFYNNINECVIKGVDPDKIQLIKYPWAKSGNVLINGKDTVYLEDIREFIPLDDHWGKTKKRIINEDKIIEGADVETFTIINSYEGKDKNYNYQFGFINDDDFKNESIRTFDFSAKDPCEYKPMVFTDIYDSLVSYTEDKGHRIKLVEKLRSEGFTVNNIRYSDVFGESKMIIVNLTGTKCDCIVEKLYRYNYSLPAETEKIFTVTERIHCRPKGK